MRFRTCPVVWALAVVMICARADDCFKQNGSNLVFAGCTKSSTSTKNAVSKEDTDGTEMRIEMQGSVTTDDTQHSPPRRAPTPFSDSHLKTALHMHKHTTPLCEMLESTADSKSATTDVPTKSATNEDSTVSGEYAVILPPNAVKLLPEDRFDILRQLLAVPDFTRRYLIFFEFTSFEICDLIQSALEYIKMPTREIEKADFETLQAKLSRIQDIANDVYRFELDGYTSAQVPWSFHSWHDVGLLTREQLSEAFNHAPITALQNLHLLEACKEAAQNYADLKERRSTQTDRASKIISNLRFLLQVTMSVPFDVIK